ncbi:MAG: glycosyl hydrolase family 25 [Oscillospiraceae bacterium]|nr:glycosyl hydrolase family 25 [Oscillospiraceae bacterium]
MDTTKTNKRRPAWGRIVLAVLLLVVLMTGIGRAVQIFRAYKYNIEVEPPDPEKYPVRGVDVSRYQGNIDWETLASQNVSFAFIKATEGSSHQDPCFAFNWEEAQKTGMYVGAYHFFSFESGGETQAQNFIETVGDSDGTLPPVVDLEFYGDYTENPLGKAETRKILDSLLAALEKHYGTKPIIYTTTRAYYSYILGGGYGDYPLWMRDVHMEPIVKWRFWQYSDQGMLKGYDGLQSDQTEVYIDLNVYNGTMKGFLREFALPEKEEKAE